MSLLIPLKSTVSKCLSGTRAYTPVKVIYQSVFNRKWALMRKERRQFYAKFIRTDDLVFDVGANSGEYSHAFLQLGARVVAVEPNPSLQSALYALGHKKQLTVRCEAVGDQEGDITLFIGKHSGHSTVSADWVQLASQNDPACRWEDET